MRKDANRVLIERPRRGHKSKHKDVRQKYNRSFDIDDEDGPIGGREGMRQPYRGIRKQNSDLWSFMRRFMAKNVGRPWNDVYSEIVNDLSETEDMKAHFLAHVRIEVDQKLVVHPNGRLYRPGRLWGDLNWDEWEDDAIPGCFKRFYIDPRDGILYKTPDFRWRGRARRAEPYHPEHGFVMPDGIVIKYIDGIWYEMKQVLKKRGVHVGFDHQGHWTWAEEEYWAAEKRQLSSQELRKYGVANAAR